MLTQTTKFKERLINFLILNLVGVGYMLTNYLVSLNAPYPTLNMQWEASIPFVSDIIFPYLSYFVVAPLIFLLPLSREKLTIYMFRFMFVAIITFTIFLTFPFENAFTRPVEEYKGFKAFLYVLLNQDLRYNQMPSFHISLSLLYSLIIIDFYKNKIIHLLSALWFIMICFCVVLMFQHHIADIVSAVLLVMITVYLSNRVVVKNFIFKSYLKLYNLLKK